MNTLFKDLKACAHEILNDASELAVPNRSGHGSNHVTVADMANPTIARANCWVTSNEIYENIELEAYADIDEVDIVGVEAKGLTHYAVYVANDEESVVLDFTARQFSPDAPFPMVMPVNVWHAYMKHVTGRNDLTLVIGD